MPDAPNCKRAINRWEPKRKRNCINLVIVVLEKKFFIPVSTGVLLLHTHPIHPCDYFSSTSVKTTTTVIHRD